MWYVEKYYGFRESFVKMGDIIVDLCRLDWFYREVEIEDVGGDKGYNCRR